MPQQPNPRRRNGHRRSELIARVRREENHCHLCGQWVDVNLPHGRPASPELDELVPVAQGGDPFARSNVRLAHRHCNRLRWHGPIVEAQAKLAKRPPAFDRDGSLVERPIEAAVSRNW